VLVSISHVSNTALGEAVNSLRGVLDVCSLLSERHAFDHGEMRLMRGEIATQAVSVLIDPMSEEMSHVAARRNLGALYP
jgi:hypothetical protein